MVKALPFMGRSSNPKKMRILVTRPLEDGEAIAARLAEMGHQALLAPLLEPRWLAGSEPDFAGVQAILATSANGIRALARRTQRRDLPVFAVGPQTTDEARKRGFTEIRNADGDAGTLADAVPRWAGAGDGALLHVCGEEAPGTLGVMLESRGFTVRRAVLYAVDAAAALPPDVATALKNDALDGALFFSPRSARVFCALTADTRRLTAFCISPATAGALPPDAFVRTLVAARPNQDSLLALLA
jgi:uroporphyrinogen-III synthase